VRLLLVTPYYAPAYHFGGPVVVAETAVRGLLALGHEVTVATTDALDDRRRIAPGAPPVPPGAEVVRFPNVSHAVAARAMGWTPRGFRRWVAAHVAEHDVVLLHDVYSVLSVGAARAAARAGVPFALQPLGSLAPSPERGRPLVKRAFLALWGRRTLTDAAALVHSTEDERRDFLAAGGPEATLVRLPLPLELPPPQGAPRAEDPTLAYVGRLDPIKGLERLLGAVAIARRSEPRLTLEVAGPGGDEYVGRLRRQARALGLEESVRFHGFVSAQEKVRLLERAHAFCLLSRSEGLPVAALEAMACGTPVVLSRGCHLPEVDGRAGVVVEGDAAGTAAAILALLDDGERRRRLGEGARAFAEDFRAEHAVGELADLLERLVAQGARGARR
jgi:glycosyltransferase involved in cell wall biosynthesis